MIFCLFFLFVGRADAGEVKNETPLYDKSSIKSKVLKVLPRETTVKIIARQVSRENKWVEVEIGDLIGYVVEEDVFFTEGDFEFDKVPLIRVRTAWKKSWLVSTNVAELPLGSYNIQFGRFLGSTWLIGVSWTSINLSNYLYLNYKGNEFSLHVRYYEPRVALGFIGNAGVLYSQVRRDNTSFNRNINTHSYYYSTDRRDTNGLGFETGAGVFVKSGHFLFEGLVNVQWLTSYRSLHDTETGVVTNGTAEFGGVPFIELSAGYAF